MKIAVVSDDGTTVARHFGRAPLYVVFTIVNNTIADREVRHKPFHPRQNCLNKGSGDSGTSGPGDGSTHQYMISGVSDCQAVVAGGMGLASYYDLTSADMEVIITHLAEVEEAASRYLAWKLAHHSERLH